MILLTDQYSETKDSIERITSKRWAIRWSIYFLIILAIIIYGDFGQKTFIYQQF
jgi:hypothetical protein